MSNSIVGDLYASIIDEVITAARADFQEEGVDEATLQDFRNLWRDRIAGTGVAKFPWIKDPEGAGDGEGPNGDGELGIKEEDDHGMPIMLPPTGVGASGAGGGGALAALRAAQQAQQRGADVKPVITQPSPSPSQAGATPTAAAAATPGSGADTDATAMQNLLNPVDTDVQNGRDPGDGLPSLQPPGVATNASAEGSGNGENKRKLSTGAEEAAAAAKKARQKRLLDLDTSDIGSDLDDSDDEDVFNDDDAIEETGIHTILCLYDKVQRVKNKWKCVLRDGLITIHGKDYTFGRGNGEFEW